MSIKMFNIVALSDDAVVISGAGKGSKASGKGAGKKRKSGGKKAKTRGKVGGKKKTKKAKRRPR